MSSLQPPQIECKWCGEKLLAGTDKCPQCGRPVLPQTTRPAEAAARSGQAPAAPVPRGRGPRKSRWPFLVAAVVVLAAGGFAIARLRQPVEFSADFVLSNDQGAVTGTIYVKSKALARMETTRSSGRSIVILNADKQVMWFLDSDKKTYYSGAVSSDLAHTAALTMMGIGDVKGSKQEKAEWDSKIVGKEVVSGYLCDKRVFDDVVLHTGTITTWTSPRLQDLDVKMESRGLKREFRNIKEQKLPQSLFELPAGYTEATPQTSQTGGLQ